MEKYKKTFNEDTCSRSKVIIKFVRKHPILGYSKMHRGVDFAAKRGTPIMAAGDGRITFSGRNGAFGRFAEIKHLNNFKTGYAHLYKFAPNIKKGKLVKQGDIIGY